MGEYPNAFLQRMENLLGGEYEAFRESLEGTRAQGLRLNCLKGREEDVRNLCRKAFHLSPVPWAREGYYCEEGDRPGKHPYHEEGLYYIQEPSAMAPAALLSPLPGERVLDLCAAPGGKTTQLAAMMDGRGLLVCNEIHPARAKILSQNVERMGIGNAVVTNMDSGSLSSRFPEYFHRILVDAPCSGEGMFRKDPEARTEWSPDKVELCSLRQREILHNAAAMVKPGGFLVYSTCTFAPEEDEETIEAFLQDHPEFSIVKREDFCQLSPGRPEWVRGGGRKELAWTFRIWPHKTRGEGHYMALLQKSGELIFDSSEAAGKESGLNAFPGDKKTKESFLAFCRETLKGEGKSLPWERMGGCYLFFGEQLYYSPLSQQELKGIKVLRTGLWLGTCRKGRFEPSHALALYLDESQVKNSAQFPADSQEIYRYLKGETLAADPSAPKGWTLVAADGFSLGWAKAAAGILKNHYPKGLRWLQ